MSSYSFLSPLLFTCTSSLPPLVDPSLSSLSSFVCFHCHSHPIFLSLFKLPSSFLLPLFHFLVHLPFILIPTLLSSSLSSSFLLPLSSCPSPLHPHSYSLVHLPFILIPTPSILLSTSPSSSFLLSCPPPLSFSFLLPLSSCPPPLHPHSYSLVHLPFHSHSYSLYLLVHLPFILIPTLLSTSPFILIPTPSIFLFTSPSSSFLLSCPPPLSFSFLLPLSSCSPPLHPHSYSLVHLPFHSHSYSLYLLVHLPFILIPTLLSTSPFILIPTPSIFLFTSPFIHSHWHPHSHSLYLLVHIPSHFILIPTPPPCHVNLHPSPHLISYLQVCFQEEHSVTTLFPEFQDISSSVTYMDILVSGTHRITAFGCQNGYIRCVQTDLTNNSKLKD